MLALPSVTAPAGFGPTAALLVGLWGLLTMEALLIAEVNLNIRAVLHATAAGGGSSTEGVRSGGSATGSSSSSIEGEGSGGSGGSDRIVTLRQMAEYTLGEAGKGEAAGCGKASASGAQVHRRPALGGAVLQGRALAQLGWALAWGMCFKQRASAPSLCCVTLLQASPSSTWAWPTRCWWPTSPRRRRSWTFSRAAARPPRWPPAPLWG